MKLPQSIVIISLLLSFITIGVLVYVILQPSTSDPVGVETNLDEQTKLYIDSTARAHKEYTAELFNTMKEDLILDLKLQQMDDDELRKENRDLKATINKLKDYRKKYNCCLNPNSSECNN